MNRGRRRHAQRKKTEFYKSSDPVTLLQFQLVCENFAYLCQPGDFDLHRGGLDETKTHAEDRTQAKLTSPGGRRHGGRLMGYLDDVNNFSAAVPELKLPDVSLHVLGESHRAHLQRHTLEDQPPWTTTASTVSRKSVL